MKCDIDAASQRAYECRVAQQRTNGRRSRKSGALATAAASTVAAAAAASTAAQLTTAQCCPTNQPADEAMYGSAPRRSIAKARAPAVAVAAA